LTSILVTTENICLAFSENELFESGAASAKTVTNIGRILAKKMCC
jgi:hypothetical protein